MIRLLLRLLGIHDFEVCKSCETLKQQLEYERLEKKQLTETLLSIIQPKVVEAQPQEIQPVIQSSALFSRRRAALEARDREEARTLRESKHIGQPDDKKIEYGGQSITAVNSLEQELGVEEKKEA